MSENKIICPQCGGVCQQDPDPPLFLPDGSLRVIHFITRAPDLGLNLAYGEGKVQISAQFCTSED